MTTTNDMLQAVRDRLDEARRADDAIFDRCAAHEIDDVAWLRESSRLMGMREAYAAVMGMLGAEY